MRNRELHDALREFALEAAAALTSDTASGAEVPFEVIEEPGFGTTLYRYRALTAAFIGERWAALKALPSFEPARDALGSGSTAYLRMRGVETGAADAEAEPALRAMLERLYDDATAFEFPEERFDRVYSEVERTLYEDTARVTLLAPVHGVLIEGDRVDLADGLALARGSVSGAPPEAVWARSNGASEDEKVVCLFERDLPSDLGLPYSEASARFRRLLTALRLLRHGPVALDPVGWARASEGAWRPFALGSSARARGEPWILADEEHEELRELLDAVTRSRHGGSVAWALSRFEMGCERALETEALSDYLLALRALLDAGDEAGRASLVLRLAALCAEEDERRPVQRRAELAFALERFVMGGGIGEAYMETIGSISPRELVGEIEQHARALLRDVLCGYLDPNLKAVADDILLDSGEIEIRARDLRAEHAEPEPVEEEPEPEPAEEEPDTEEQPPAEPVEAGPEDAVTPSADWAYDEDPASYSAPV